LLQNAGGFVYQIALKGVTGARDALPEDWRGHVERLRKFTQLPVCLGFGVSHGNMAREVAKVADGVIVGSALVRKIAENEQNWREPLTDFTRELAEAIHTLN
ncbi:MAG: tryptophan synthase subunit alpha, partial [Lentisphaerae bacterium]